MDEMDQYTMEMNYYDSDSESDDSVVVTIGKINYDFTGLQSGTDGSGVDSADAFRESQCNVNPNIFITDSRPPFSEEPRIPVLDNRSSFVDDLRESLLESLKSSAVSDQKPGPPHSLLGVPTRPRSQGDSITRLLCRRQETGIGGPGQWSHAFLAPAPAKTELLFVNHFQESGTKMET